MKILDKLKTLLPPLETAIELFTPFGAALAAFALHSAHASFLWAAGWILAVLHFYLQGPPILAQARARLGRFSMGFALPRAALVTGQIVSGNGSLWRYFLDQVMLDLVTLGVALIFMVLFKKGLAGKSAFKELGVVMVLLVVAIFGVSCAGYVLTWLEFTPLWDWQHLAGMGAGFVLGVGFRVRLLSDNYADRYDPDSGVLGGEVAILVILLAWGALLPLAGWLIARFA